MNEQFSNGDSTLKESVANAQAGVKATVREVKDTLKAKTKEVAAQAKEYGGEFVQRGKERTASRMGGFSETMRQTADRFEREQDPNIALYTRLLADKLDGAATYVRERDLNQLRHDGENLARQHPGLFFGGMFLAGFAAARFLKASATREEVTEGWGEGEESVGAAEGRGAESHESVAEREPQECGSCQPKAAM